MGRGYAYADPTGSVRAIRYTRSGLQLEVRGPDFTPISGPVGYLQAQLAIGDHPAGALTTSGRNDAAVVRSRRPSLAASRGEAGFWDALLGDDSSETREQEAIGLLETAVRRTPRDGRSHFLLGMLHLYRFGQRVVRFDTISAAARDELAAANVSFATAVPLLWDDANASGDSRVPGFAAAAKYLQGVVEDDGSLRDAGLAELDRSIEINSFFNVFDYIPVMQFLPPSDPLFQKGFALFTTYLEDPETLGCVGTQQEICANAGLAPHNIQGALTLFGDLYAKGGDVDRAQVVRLASVSGHAAGTCGAPRRAQGERRGTRRALRRCGSRQRSADRQGRTGGARLPQPVRRRRAPAGTAGLRKSVRKVKRARSVGPAMPAVPRVVR